MEGIPYDDGLMGDFGTLAEHFYDGKSKDQQTPPKVKTAPKGKTAPEAKSSLSMMFAKVHR